MNSRARRRLKDGLTVDGHLVEGLLVVLLDSVGEGN